MLLTALRKSTQNLQYLKNSIGVVPSLLSVLVTQQKLVWSLLTNYLVSTPTLALDATPTPSCRMNARLDLVPTEEFLLCTSGPGTLLLKGTVTLVHLKDGSWLRLVLIVVAEEPAHLKTIRVVAQLLLHSVTGECAV